MELNTNNVRIPVIPLDIEHIALAESKELLCDYKNAKLYIKNGDLIVDITSVIKDVFIKEGVSIDKCTIVVDGMGIVDISSAINHIIHNLINIVDVGSESTQIISGYNVDLMSITNKNKKLQITGFDTANNGTVPVKNGNTITWINISGNGIGDIDPGEGNIPTSNVYVVNPENSIIQLTNKQFQHTNNLELETSLVVLMPTSNSQYHTITWRIDTVNNEIYLAFNNVSWEYSKEAEILDKNSIYILNFETWDYGITWLGKVLKYNKPTFEDTVFNAITPRVYSKEEINTLMSWINGGE